MKKILEIFDCCLRPPESSGGVSLWRQSRERFGGSDKQNHDEPEFTNSDLQKFIFLLSADQIISVPLTNTIRHIT